METKVPTRKPRGFKIALIVLASLFLLFVLAIFLLPYFLPIGTIKNIAKTQARDLAGMDVDFESLGFGWNGGVVVDKVVLSPLKPDGTPGDSLLTVDEVRANVSLLPLLSGKIIVNSVVANGFSLNLVREEDGSLNLPDFSKLPASTQASGRAPARDRMLLSAMAPEAEPVASPAATPAASGIPPIELHRVELKKGVVSLEDKATAVTVDLGIDFLNLEGGDLNEPFLLQGRLLPYPDAPNKGEIPFTGRVALIRDLAFNPDGEANVEIDVKAFSLHELAAKLGLGDLLVSGQADGVVKAAYTDGKGALAVSDLRLAKANLGLGDDKIINIPDTMVSLKAQLDPVAGTVALSDMSLTNAITDIRGRGWVEGLLEMREGGMPVGSVDYAGVADFEKATDYLRAQGMGIEGLPTLAGNGSFAGKITLPKAEAGAPMAPALTLDFTDGNLGAVEESTGIGVNIGLKGIGVRAAATLAQAMALNAAVNLANVPLRAAVPQLGRTPVDVTLNGGVAFASDAETTAAELRLKDTLAKVPASPYATAMEVKCPETKLTYDLIKDVATIQAMAFTINDSIQGEVSSGTITGILAGDPQGQADVTFRALLEQVKEVFRPSLPEMLVKMSGSASSVTRIRVEGGAAQSLTRAELDKSTLVLNVEPGVSQAQLETPKALVALAASLAIDNPLNITLNSLDVNAEGATVSYVDKAGDSMAGRFGVSAVKAAGVVDAASLNLSLSGLTLDVNGMSMVIGQGGRQVAGLTGGAMKIQGPTQEQPLVAPISGEGDFNVPALDVGVDNLVFFRMNGDQREDSNFGNVRGKLGVDGYIGKAKQQIVNLRTGALTSNTLAANSRGWLDLTNNTLEAQYAARLAPSGMSSLIGFLGLPPTLLAEAAVSGTLAWNGSQLDSKGQVQGRLQLASGDVNPFEMVHDVSAAVDTQQETLAVSIRSLGGNVKTPAGEAVATMQAQPSNLLLSRAGSKGFIDIRFQGAAGPTRQLLVGLVGVIPQMREHSTLLYQTLADGVYQGWIQIAEQGESTLGLKMGGIWQGAALTLDNTPLLAESGNLSAGLEGQFAYRDNLIRISGLSFASDSAQLKAGGTAQVSLATDANRAITGLANLNVDLNFSAADLSKVVMVFPGLMPVGMRMAGRVDGAFRAGGDSHDIRVQEGVVRFQGFQAAPSPDLVVAVPSGTANFGATVSLQAGPNAGTGPASDFEMLRMFTVTGGQASLTGALLKDKPIEDMSASFDLQNGVLTLQSAQLRIGGGADAGVMASGTVDFNGAAPAVAVRVQARNIPMSEVNSEIQQFASIESGVINLPANPGEAASVSFTGFSENEILQTLSVQNFTFATGPVVMHTGPTLNAELDKARALLKMEANKGDDSRRITLTSIRGSVHADGSGVISIPHETPIDVIGDNTGDFRAWGEVYADHTLHIKVAVVGKLENIIGFSLPNLIPNLRSGSEEDRNRFMAKMNQNAAKEHYSLRITGTFDSPDISGIGAIAGAFARDIFTAAPGQILGGVADLGKDAPGALLDAAGAILSAPGQAVKSPGSVPGAIIRTPENTLKGIGRAFGVTRDRKSGREEESQEEAVEEAPGQ